MDSAVRPAGTPWTRHYCRVLVTTAALSGAAHLAGCASTNAWAQPNIGAPPAAASATAVPPAIRAERALRRGDVALALELAETQLKTEPDNVSAAFVRAVALAELKQTDRALAAFTDLTQKHPHLAEPYNNVAVILAERGDFDQARVALEQSIGANPDNATAFVNLGDVHAALAARSYERALKLAPRDRAARAKLALARQLRDPVSGAPANDAATDPIPSSNGVKQ